MTKLRDKNRCCKVILKQQRGHDDIGDADDEEEEEDED